MRESSVRRRFLQGAGANAYGVVVAAVVQLAGVPILLYAWGAQRYGAWLVLFAVPAYLSLTNLGYSLSIANDMTMRVARGDREGARRAFQSLIALVVASGLAVAALASVVFLSFPVSGWLHLRGITPLSARLILFLLSAEVLAQLANGVAAAGYRAGGDYALGVTINNSTILAQYVLLWGAALVGLGLLGAAATFLVVRILGSVAALLCLRLRHSWLRFGVGRTDIRYLRRLVRPSLANVLIPLANALKNQGLVLVVNVLLGPIAVVTFSVLRTLSRLPLRLVITIANAVEPELAIAKGRSDRVLQGRLYLGGLQASFWLSSVACVALYFSGQPLLALWTGGAVRMDRALFIWLLASAAAAALWQMSLAALQALNFHARAAAAYLAVAGAVVGTAYFLIRATSRVADAGLVMLCGDCVFMAYAAVAAGGTLELGVWQTARTVANPLPLLRLARLGSASNA